MSLFREEVLAQKMENLHGTINLAVPVSWQLISFSLATILAAAAIFLMSANYSRTEIASGTILPAAGILQIIPARPGRVDDISVREGQSVHKGDRLAWIRIEEADRSGVGKQTAILSAIEQQRQGLLAQQVLGRTAAVAQQQGYLAQIGGLREEVENIDAVVAP